MFCMLNEKKTYLAYFPKQLKLWKTSYLFNDFKQKRMTLYCRKILFPLLRGIIWKYHLDFHCLNCLHYFGTKNKFQSREKLCKNKSFRNVLMSFFQFLGWPNYSKFTKNFFVEYFHRIHKKTPVEKSE